MDDARNGTKRKHKGVRMMAVRKIELMHEIFGRTENAQCKDCKHLIKNGYVKCKVYGETSSEATDWKQKQTACGLFNKPFVTDIPIVRLVRNNKQAIQIDGQLDLFGGNYGVQM